MRLAAASSLYRARGSLWQGQCSHKPVMFFLHFIIKNSGPQNYAVGSIMLGSTTCPELEFAFCPFENQNAIDMSCYLQGTTFTCLFT